jgi:alcohol dehydrogenase (quinone), cytochrome c subunit
MKVAKILSAMVLVLAGAQFARADEEGKYDKGEYVARAADCVACHSVPSGKAFAGGLKMGSPLGVIYTTNITPDPETGIGTYTLEDFGRAVRHGVAKDGHRLYPAMPYPSYAKMTDEDIHALYDFFMKEVPPVVQRNRPDEIPSYLSFRWPLAIWNFVFTDGASYRAKSEHDAQWNRGAYLVQGAGHCGACHTPRGYAFQETALDESSPNFLSGAILDEWSAPNLRENTNTGLGGWSQADLFTFLKTGHNRDGTAFGSMTDVINNSSPFLTDDDLNAMAAYMKSLPAVGANQAAYAYDAATATKLRAATFDQTGAAIYSTQCVFCHLDDGKGFSPYLPPLAGNPTVLDANASSLINIVLNGSWPLVVKGIPDAYRMPQFRVLLNDKQIADVVTFIRNGWGNHGAAVAAGEVASMRQTTDPTSDRIVILKMR